MINDMKTYRDSLLAKLHILIKEQGIDDETKRTMYAGYGVETAADMTDYQLSHLIARLEGREVGSGFVIPFRREVGPETRRLRSQCLKLITGSPDAAVLRMRGLGLPNDWTIINPFVQHHAGALLNQLSDGSLIDFVRKLRKIRDSGWRYRSPEKPGRKQEPAVVLVAASGGSLPN